MLLNNGTMLEVPGSFVSYLTVCKFLTCTAAYLLYRHWYQMPRSFPPGPRGIPILGVLPLLGRHPERKLNEWKREYGPVMGARVGRKNWVVLGDCASIKMALMGEGDIFSGRPSPHKKEDGIVFLDNGRSWTMHKTLGLLAFRGFGITENKSLEKHVIEEVSYLKEAVRSKRGVAFSIDTILTNAVSNVLCSILLGQRFQYSDQRFKRIIHQLSRRFYNPLGASASTGFGFEALTNFFQKRKQTRRQKLSILKRTLLGFINIHEKTYDSTNIRDFIDAFLLLKHRQLDESFNDKQLIHYIYDLFLGGTETTTGTLRWAILCLLHYPEKQAKLRKEIIQVLGDQEVTILKKHEMPYASAFIHEVYRFRTLFPLGLPHKTSHQVILDSYVIPQGTTVCTNLWAVHNDPKVFDEPEEFKPERHLYGNGEFGRSPYVIPFSVGPRHCLGEQLASMMLFIYLVSLVRSFEFLPDPKLNGLPDIKSGASGPVFLPKSFNVVAREL
uniref:cytochrome P450 2C42-like isoform X1 n=1 Tax=Ciona intestinalis TaxID=7719 RepID=UPI000EF43C77|nr:cytochrome P450 2C42-like isoform X1 [Ciona intestinalis]|eukprot:XP_002125700.2 cytochrome P450 2C42-like isoform X1 [Ciona intestinalis]